MDTTHSETLAPLVLVIDDDPIAQELLSRRLSASGYRVVIESDGGAGIWRARTDRPALVICDLHMPLAPGELVILSLRTDPKTKDIPIIVLSADPGRLGPEHEVDFVLAKPVRPKELMDAIGGLVQTPERRVS